MSNIHLHNTLQVQVSPVHSNHDVAHLAHTNNKDEDDTGSSLLSHQESPLLIGRRSPRSCQNSDKTELVSLDYLFILWVYSFELLSTSSTHCPGREAENGSAYTWKDPSRNLKTMGDQSSAKAETEASRGSYANHHPYQKSIDPKSNY